MEKLSNTETELKKMRCLQKSVYLNDVTWLIKLFAIVMVSLFNQLHYSLSLEA